MRLKNLLITLVMTIPITGCQKLTDVDAPDGRITNIQAFNNEQNATAAVLAIYAQAAAYTNIVTGYITSFSSLCSDDLNYAGTNKQLQEFYDNSISTDNIRIKNNFWDIAYSMIYNTNACLEGLSQSTRINAGLREQLIGECRFMRALIYFNLIQLFGEVPLILSTNYQTNIRIGRTAMQEIQRAILDDLRHAQEGLTERYPSSEKIRPNKWAATALLTRFQLYRRDWKSAYDEASKIIESSQYRLNIKLDSVFLGNSSEAIFQIKPILTGFNTFDADAFIPGENEVPDFLLTKSLLNVFDSTDLRLQSWIGKKILNGVEYYYPYKYKIAFNVDDDFPPTEYNMILRFAEIYLARAESAIELNRLPEAISDINIIRSRAGLHGIIEITTKEELRSLIERERRTEFFAECGHRWFDLKRTGRATEVLSYKLGWQATDTLWPLPFSQILLNPALTQNGGY